MVRLRTLVTDLNSQMSYLPRALSLVWSASRPWTTAWLVVVLLEGMTPAALVYLTRPLIDAIVSALGAGGSWESISPVLWPAGLMAAVIALRSVSRVRGSDSRVTDSRVRSLPLLFGYTLDQSANCRVVQFQVTCDFHLTVPVLVYRL
jgi:hypothetical protein